MNCRRGDVILVLFPDSNLRTSKRRPALVVQADHLGAGLPQTIVAMITSNMARAGHASRVVVRVDSESAKGSGLFDGLDNYDRQPRYHPVLGDRSDPRGFLGAEGTRRSLANHPGIVVETSQNQFLATTVNSLPRLIRRARQAFYAGLQAGWNPLRRVEQMRAPLKACSQRP